MIISRRSSAWNEGRDAVKWNRKRKEEPVVLQTLQKEHTFSFKKWHTKGPGIARDMVKVQSWRGRGRERPNGTQSTQNFTETSEGVMYIHTDTRAQFAHTNHLHEGRALHLCTLSLATQIQRHSFNLIVFNWYKHKQRNINKHTLWHLRLF